MTPAKRGDTLDGRKRYDFSYIPHDTIKYVNTNMHYYVRMVHQLMDKKYKLQFNRVSDEKPQNVLFL